MPERGAGDGSGAADNRLADAVRAATSGAGRFVVLVGDPSLTDTRVRGTVAWVPGFRPWIPAGPEELAEGLPSVAPRTAIGLVDLARFLLPADLALGAAVASALRAAVLDGARGPLLVVASLRPGAETWRRLTRPPASGGREPFVEAQAQALLRYATVVPVVDSLVAGPSVGVITAGAPRVIEPLVSDAEPGGAVAPVNVVGPVPVAVPAEAIAPVDEIPSVDVALPVDVAPPVEVPESPDAVRRRAALREASGNLEGAERLYERAAMSGDLEALASLGRLRNAPPGEDAPDPFVAQAVIEGNTAVLFTLAAAGHPGALAALAMLREDPPAEESSR